MVLRAGIVACLLTVFASGCERRPSTGSAPQQPHPASANPAAPDTGALPMRVAASREVALVPAPSATKSAPSTAVTWPSDRIARPVADTGIYPDLDDQVRVRPPAWLSTGPWTVLEAPGTNARYLVVDGVAVGFAPPDMPTTLRVESLSAWDRDGDAIPDPLDILLGAKKTVLNGAAYRSTYRVIPFPGGDMPRTEGVCTDVVVRALRNAGIDLQKEIYADAKVRRAAYPGIQKPDRNIDHRRVRNLVPYFKRYWTSLPVDPKDHSVPWMPGDVVFLDTMNDAQPEHLGIVSDELAASGLPLIINNWTDGTKTAEMDLLSFVPVRHRFRVPTGELKAR